MLGCLQMDATLLTNNSQHCWMLHVASVCTPCCILLDVVAQSLKLVKLFSQQLPTFLLFRDRRSVAQQCSIRLHSSSNVVGAAHAHYAWFTKTYGLYPSHDALQVLTLRDHCQHARNNSQHCWHNIGSCCIHLHAALQGKWWEEVRKLKQQAAMITSLWFYSALMISELQYFNWPIYNTQPSSLKYISCWFFRSSLVWQDTKTSNVLQSETFTDNIQDSQENAKTQSCKSSV